MYKFKATSKYLRKYRKLTKKNSLIESRIDSTIEILKIDPFSTRIKTHKINEIYSSRVTGDIRILWKFENNTVKLILLIDIGGHDGKNSVYK